MNPTLKHLFFASLACVAVVALGTSASPAPRAQTGSPDATTRNAQAAAKPTLASVLEAAAGEADVSESAAPAARPVTSRRVRQALVMPYFSFGSRG